MSGRRAHQRQTRKPFTHHRAFCAGAPPRRRPRAHVSWCVIIRSDPGAVLNLTSPGLCSAHPAPCLHGPVATLAACEQEDPARHNRAPTPLWLPRWPLSPCVRAVVSRSTPGIGQHWPGEWHDNHFPATPLCTIRWFFAGHADLLEPERPPLRLPQVSFAGPSDTPRVRICTAGTASAHRAGRGLLDLSHLDLNASGRAMAAVTPDDRHGEPGAHVYATRNVDGERTSVTVCRVGPSRGELQGPSSRDDTAGPWTAPIRPWQETRPDLLEFDAYLMSGGRTVIDGVRKPGIIACNNGADRATTCLRLSNLRGLRTPFEGDKRPDRANLRACGCWDCSFFMRNCLPGALMAVAC